MTKKAKSASHDKNAKGKETVKAKGRKKSTRDKILKAAQQVFATHPYHSASIRMIGKLAEIEHPLISYYFPTKSDLFSAVIQDQIDSRVKLESVWFADVKGLGPERGFSLYLDYVLDDFRKRPGLLQIVSLNLSRSSESELIPGYDKIQEFMQTLSKRFIDTFGQQVSQREGLMFARAISALLVAFLGSADSYSSMMKMESDSIVYYNWVKDTLIYTLLPRIERIINP